MSQLNRLVKKAENCFERCVIEIKKTKGASGVPIDFYLNTCLDCIEAVNKLPESKTSKEKAREAIFNVYFKLQKYNGSERQTTHPFPIGKEISIEVISMPLKSADEHSGGLGFSAVPDDLFLQRSGKSKDPYWNPPKRPAPVKTLPKEDYPAIMEEYEERRLESDRLTMQEFHKEMEQEKREILHEMRQLRKGCDTDKRDVPIM